MIEIVDKKYQDEKEAITALSSGFTLGEKIMWTPESFKTKDIDDNYVINKKKWPVFIFRTISAYDLMNLQEMIEKLSDDSNTVELFKQFSDAVRDNLIDVKNVENREQILENPLKCITKEFLVELASAIISGNRLSSEELEGLEY